MWKEDNIFIYGVVGGHLSNKSSREFPVDESHSKFRKFEQSDTSDPCLFKYAPHIFSAKNCLTGIMGSFLHKKHDIY